jgi:hypothetical protein
MYMCIIPVHHRFNNITLFWPYLQRLLRNHILEVPIHSYRSLSVQVPFSSSGYKQPGKNGDFFVCITTIVFYEFSAFIYDMVMTVWYYWTCDSGDWISAYFIVKTTWELTLVTQGVVLVVAKYFTTFEIIS